MSFTKKSIDGYRFYIKDGKYYISNTSIGKFMNKPSINKWQMKLALGYVLKQGNVTPNIISDALEYPEKHLHELADKGTAKHNLMENFLLTGERPKRSKWMDIFVDWKKNNNFKTKASLIEKALFNPELGVAGTADLIGTVNGELTLVDLKTSGGVYLGHLVQVCGYKLMIGKPIKLAILQISRDASSHSFHILDEVEEECGTIIFRALLDIFKAQLKIGELKLDIDQSKLIYNTRT